MRAQPVLDRLDGLGFVETGGPIEWAGQKTIPRLPAAFYVPRGERAGANSLNGLVGASDQRVEVEFAVNIVLAGAAASNRKISDKLEEMIAAVKGRLVGWQHPQATVPTEYAGGDLLDADGTQITWSVRFRTAYRLRKTS